MKGGRCSVDVRSQISDQHGTGKRLGAWRKAHDGSGLAEAAKSRWRASRARQLRQRLAAQRLEQHKVAPPRTTAQPRVAAVPRIVGREPSAERGAPNGNEFWSLKPRWASELAWRARGQAGT